MTKATAHPLWPSNNDDKKKPLWALCKLAEEMLRAFPSEIAPSDACRAALANIMARIDGDEFVPTEYKEDAKKALASFPSATPLKWIPVSERLPEHKDLMLCCGDRAVGMTSVRPGYWDEDDNTWWMQCAGNSWDASEPTHWMPFPEAP